MQIGWWGSISLQVITPHTAPSGSDTAQQHLSSPRGARGRSTSSPSAHATCALRRHTVAGREASGGCHVGSLCAQLPSQTAPEGLILAHSALALSLLAKIFFKHHNKVLCSSLAGYFTKAQQGQGKHNSDLETYQRQGTSLERVSTPPATFGKYTLSVHLPKLQVAHGRVLFPQLLCQPSVSCLLTGVFALSCWDLQFTPSLFFPA